MRSNIKLCVVARDDTLNHLAFLEHCRKRIAYLQCRDTSACSRTSRIHVFCLQERLRGDRFARHWHDVARLDEAGLATAACADRELANAVARHKGMFFAEKAADRTPIDYATAVNGGLQLVPDGDGLKALEDDYARMVEDGLLLEDAESFEALMARCGDIAARANRAAA